MSADTVALFWGSAFLGFAPLFCFFFQITYPKSQLIIVFVTAAFFYLLSCLGASVLWYLLDPIIGLGNAWSALIPGIFMQYFGRCAFVGLYHKVEAVIEISIEKTENEQNALARESDPVEAAASANPDATADIETAKLKLEMNDVASGLAAGTGFGGMHAILMFGSLLASEATDFGVLYQPSCPLVPSLMVNATNCFLFFFLDILWMLFTFFGMRRRLIFPRGGGTLRDMGPNRRRRFGTYFGNTRSGGNAALLCVLVSHFLAAGATTFNSFENGCAFSLSILPAVTLGVAYLFWAGVSLIYLPLPNSTVRLSLPASFSYGSRAEAMLNGEGQNVGGQEGVPSSDPIVQARM